MKFFKPLLFFAFGILSMQQVEAQTAMMDPISYKLKNGITVIVAENQSANKVFSNFSIESENVAKNSASIKTILTAILNEKASKNNVDVSFDEKGGNIAVLPESFENSLTALFSIVQEPIIDQSLLDQIKLKIIASVNARDQYYPESVTAESVNLITLDQIKEFHNSEIVPANTFLTIAGNITPSEAKILVKKTFGNWKETTFAVKAK